jgi:reactive intermediate/imine deaminase
VNGEPIVRIRLTDRLPEPISHYTDAVWAGDTIWISGMLGVDATGTLVGEGDVVAQAEQVFRNLAAVLDHAGADFGDVVKVVVYLIEIEHRVPVNAVRRRYFGDARPASTLVEVSALAVPQALVEIDAVVHAPRSGLPAPAAAAPPTG